jgi:hypothetical protein
LDVGLEVNTEKTRYMVMLFLQNARKNYDLLLIANKSFENVAEIKYFGNNIKEIKITFTKEIRAA